MKKGPLIVILTSFAAISILFIVGFIATQVEIYNTISNNGLTATAALTTASTDGTTSTEETSTITNTTETITDTTLTSTTNTTEETSYGVKLADTVAPVIKLIGSSPLYLKTGTVFVDPGALAYDDRDGDISIRILRENNVNTQVAGIYRVIYGVADRAGNKTRAERTVIVVANTENSTTETVQKLSEPISEPPPTTTIAPEPIEPPITKITTASQAEIDRILEVIQSENIERIEAEKRRILEEARRAMMSEQATTTTIAPHIIDKLAELRERRPTTTPEIIQEKMQKIAERREAVSPLVRLDGDQDGISDYDEEFIYKTDPQNLDTDGDGYSDGSEILGGYDPLDPDIQGRIAYEDPRERGEIQKDFFAVAAITPVAPSSESSATATEEKIANKIEFKGKGLPNSFVTIYIFSTPIVVTVKTDEDGNWEYVLDKELSDGSHELHVAMTDDTGKILVKGSPIPFVKTAQAITVDQNLLAPFGGTKGTSLVWNAYMYATVLSILAVIGIAFIFIGMRAGPYARPYRDDEPRGGDFGGTTNAE